MKKVFCLIGLIAFGCHNLKEHSVTVSQYTKEEKSHLLDTALTRLDWLITRASLKKFYRARNYALFWGDSLGKKNSGIDSLMHIIRNADQYGLIPQDYHLYALDSILIDSISANRISMRDLLLTDSYLALCYHVKHGRLDPKSFQRIDLSSEVDEQAIASLENLKNFSIRGQLNLFEPQIKQYQLLKKALQASLITPKMDSLNFNRLLGISVNMERWRWEKLMPDRYVSVNSPAFTLRVVEFDSVLLYSKVIVGRRETPTPVLESIIRSFTIYPYWHVPRSISTKEILPALQADSSYLRKHNFEVLNKYGVVIDDGTIHWRSYDAENFPFILRQREGSENSMGIIKFNFTNKYGVYLHDTNSKRLFSNTKRDLSHGCVRVSRAIDLAHYLVREDDIYVSPEDLDQYLSLQQRLKIELRKPIIIKLQYFTCEIESGVTLFYDDIYKKDSLMIQELYQRHAVVKEKPLL